MRTGKGLFCDPRSPRPPQDVLATEYLQSLPEKNASRLVEVNLPDAPAKSALGKCAVALDGPVKTPVTERSPQVDMSTGKERCVFVARFPESTVLRRSAIWAFYGMWIVSERVIRPRSVCDECWRFTSASVS